MLEKVRNRLRRHARVRKKVEGNTERPRLCVFRSNANIYAQVIDDVSGKTLCSVSDVKMDKKATKTDRAQKVGTEIAELLKQQNVSTVVFDRGGFAFHGRVKALAEAAKQAGLNF